MPIYFEHAQGLAPVQSLITGTNTGTYAGFVMPSSDQVAWQFFVDPGATGYLDFIETNIVNITELITSGTDVGTLTFVTQYKGSNQSTWTSIGSLVTWIGNTGGAAPQFQPGIKTITEPVSGAQAPIQVRMLVSNPTTPTFGTGMSSYQVTGYFVWQFQQGQCRLVGRYV